MARWIRPFEDLDKFMEDLYVKPGWDMATDLYEDNGNIIVEMSAPGFNLEKIEINIENTHLKVTGTREEKEEQKEKNFYRKEIRRGSFERVIELPVAVDSEQTKAEFKDGILKIIMPKKVKSEAKKIKIVKS